MCVYSEQNNGSCIASDGRVTKNTATFLFGSNQNIIIIIKKNMKTKETDANEHQCLSTFYSMSKNNSNRCLFFDQLAFLIF